MNVGVSSVVFDSIASDLLTGKSIPKEVLLNQYFNYTFEEIRIYLFRHIFGNYNSDNYFDYWKINVTSVERTDSLNKFDKIFFTSLISHLMCYCEYISSTVDSQTCETMPRATPFGICMTHYYDRDKINISIVNNVNMFLLSNRDKVDGIQLNYPITNKRFILHPVTSGPELTSDEISINLFNDNNYLIKLTRYDFIRQPPPYDTQCHNYGNRSRFDCLNNCYHDQYMKISRCIPFERSLYTFSMINKTEYQSLRFCRIFTEIENSKIIRPCEFQCQISCKDTKFISFEEKREYRNIKIKFHDQDNYMINYEPNMNIFRFLISAINLVSSFYGTTIFDIMFIFKNLITYILSKIIITQNEKLFGSIKVCFYY